MKISKQNNAKKYIALFCGCVMTVTLSSAFIINSKSDNNENIKNIKTNYINYSFSNVYTYDEVPKYIAVVSELTINAHEKNIMEKIQNNKLELEEKKKIEEEKLRKEQEEQAKKQALEEKQNKLEEEKKKLEEQKQQVAKKTIVYDNMTLEELIEKLNKSLNSTISNQGNLIATYSLEKGVDPYIATAIMLHETGCKWTCSELVQKCNNVGGVKGSPSCGSGSYKAYDTLEDGIKGYIDNLSQGYFNQGLSTPEDIVRKYTGFNNTNWLEKVNKYVEDIKAQ